MSFSYKIDSNNKLITVKWDGEFTLTEVNSALASLYESAEYNPNYKGLADVRTANFLMSPEELAENQKFVSSHPNHPTGPWAVVCSEPIQTAYAMHYKEMEDTSHQTEVFSTFSAATQWLFLEANE